MGSTESSNPSKSPRRCMLAAVGLFAAWPKLLLTLIGCAALVLGSGLDHTHTKSAVDQDCVVCQFGAALADSSAPLNIHTYAEFFSAPSGSADSVTTAAIYPKAPARAPPVKHPFA